MIKLSIDVDYPYPSRFKSFLHTALNLKVDKDYLKNSRIIAQMINESKREVMGYWFFTPATMPGHELLALLGKDKHEVALHVAKDPFADLKALENATGRRVKYYTVHGTERLLARIMWRHTVRGEKAHVPNHFPLKYFYPENPPVEIDVLCYANPTPRVVAIAESSIATGRILHIHPEWLFQRGTINHRGPVYESLKKILQVDEEFGTLSIRKKSFAKIARDVREYQRDLAPTDGFIGKLMNRGIDVFTFVERKWCCTIPKPKENWAKSEDNIALLPVTTFDRWWESIGKKTRTMVRKAEKNGVKTEIAEPNQKLAGGIWKIYNETPIRQERAFPHYGISLENVERNVLSSQDTFIGAFYQDELVGFLQLAHGYKVAVVSQILSLQKHSDKAVNNALVAKAVDVCATQQCGWLMYGRMGNHPSLDSFKQNNGFVKFPLTRYYIPITRKGRIAIGMGLHREMKDVLPQSVKYPLIPVFNWLSRNKVHIKLRLS
jgi:hypothetical protein